VTNDAITKLKENHDFANVDMFLLSLTQDAIIFDVDSKKNKILAITI